MASATVSVSNTTAASVLALIRAVSGHSLDPGAGALLTIRGDDGNASGLVYVGDALVSSSNYAIALGAGDSRTYTLGGGGGPNCISLADKFLKASTTSQKVDLDWYYA